MKISEALAELSKLEDKLDRDQLGFDERLTIIETHLQQIVALKKYLTHDTDLEVYTVDDQLDKTPFT